MRRFALSLLLLGFAACGSAVDEPVVINFEADAGTLTDEGSTAPTGAALYAAHCETCHGPEATGATTWTGSIRGLEIEEIVTNGRGTMAAVAIDREQRDAIQGYLDSFGVVQAELSGREIFQNRCAPCHGDRGEGTAKSFPIQFMHPQFSTWLVRNGRDSRTFEGPMPAYTETEISDQQLGEMIDFMWGQAWPGGGEALYGAFCTNCHGADGRNGYVGRAVARRPNTQTMIRNGHGGTAYPIRTAYMPKWSADLLSDAEVQALDAYVQSL